MPPSQRPKDNWRKPNSGPASRPGAAKAPPSRRWLGAALVLAALAGVAAGLFFFLRPDPEPVLLAIPVTQYSHPDWPANPFAESDARGFRERFGSDSAQAFQVQEKARILREIQRVVDETRGGRRTAAFYLSILGATSDGKPYLLPGDARPEDPSGWLTLDELLQPLHRSDTPRILVLDVRPVSSPRSVLPTEDVNELLDAALARLEKSNDLPFTVLLAHTPCSGANVVRPLKRSTFGLALAQAAGGAADGWNASRTKDGRISIAELAAYVREVTPALSTAYGHPPQAPRVYGPASEAIVLHVPKEGAAALPAMPEPEPYPEFLRDAWKDRDAWVAAKLHQRAPRLVNHFSLAATRAEQRWLAGTDAKTAGDQFLPVATDLRDTAKSLTVPVPMVRSIAKFRGTQPVGWVNPMDAALRSLVDKIRDPAGMKKEELQAAIQAVWAKPLDVEPYHATAAAIFSAAVGSDDPTFDQIRSLSQTVAAMRLKPKPPELLALDLLAGLPPELTVRWPAGGIRTFLLTVSRAEDAVVFDGRCLPWLQARLEEADAIRWKAEATLCNPESPDDSLRTALTDLERARSIYGSAATSADDLGAAFAEYEVSRAALVDLAIAFPQDLAPIPEAVATAWAALVEDDRRLQALLRPPTGAQAASLADLPRVTQSVRSNRERLRSFLKVPENASPRLLETALAWPEWTGAERAALLARLDSTGREAASRMLGVWPTQPGQEPGVPAKCSAKMAQIAVRDLRRIVDLLRLTDGPDAADLAAKSSELGEASSPRDVATLAIRARSAWRSGLADEYRKADAKRQAAIGWAVDPDDVPAVAKPGTSESANPELPRVREAEKAYHVWLGDAHYRREAAEIRLVDMKYARDHAAALDDLARDLVNASP